MCTAMGALGLWAWMRPDDERELPVARSEPAQPEVPAKVTPAQQTPGGAPPVAGNIADADNTQALARATGWPSAELDALRAELRGQPQGEAEIRRVMAWLVFSSQWQAFDEQRRAAAPRETLRPLAMQLDAALPQHWRQGELTGAQAVQLKALLLDVLHADAAIRQAEMNRWLAEHQPSTPANTVATSR